MKYEVILDLRGYVSLIRHTGTVRDYVELNLEDYDFTEDRIHAYKLGKNELIFDPVRYEEIQKDKEHKADEKEISELKAYLYETDYITSRCFEEIMALDNRLTWIVDVLVITAKYSKQYREALARRVWARARIEELENKWN